MLDMKSKELKFESLLFQVLNAWETEANWGDGIHEKHVQIFNRAMKVVNKFSEHGHTSYLSILRFSSFKELTIPEYRKALTKGSKKNAVEIALYHIERCRVLEKKLKNRYRKIEKLDKKRFDNVNLATCFPVKSTDSFIDPLCVDTPQKKSEKK